MYNGVSTQAPGLRLNTQCSELINGYPDIIKGLSKRNSSVLRFEDGEPVPIGYNKPYVWQIDDNTTFLCFIYEKEVFIDHLYRRQVHVKILDSADFSVLDDVEVHNLYTGGAEDYTYTALSDPIIDFNVQLMGIGNSLYILNRDLEVVSDFNIDPAGS